MSKILSDISLVGGTDSACFRTSQFCRKLQLARFQWYLLLDESTYETDLQSLVAKMKETLKETAEEEVTDHGPHTVPTAQTRTYFSTAVQVSQLTDSNKRRMVYLWDSS